MFVKLYAGGEGGGQGKKIMDFENLEFLTAIKLVKFSFPQTCAKDLISVSRGYKMKETTLILPVLARGLS